MTVFRSCLGIPVGDADGDLLVQALDDLRRPVLAEGEVTGHAHRIADPASGRVFSVGPELYLEVLGESATIVHEEHGPITLPRGGYTVRIQREYSPEEIRAICRERNITWLIVKQDLQDEEDAVDQEKDQITAALEEDFEQVESLANYDIYRRIDPNAKKDLDDDDDDDKDDP